MSEYDKLPSEDQLQPDGKLPRQVKQGIGCGMITLTVVFSLLGGALGAGGFLLGYRSLERNNTQNVPLLEGLRENIVIETVPVQTDEVMTAAQVYANNVHSTVGITTSVTTNFWGFQSTSAASA